MSMALGLQLFLSPPTSPNSPPIPFFSKENTNNRTRNHLKHQNTPLKYFSFHSLHYYSQAHTTTPCRHRLATLTKQHQHKKNNQLFAVDTEVFNLVQWNGLVFRWSLIWWLVTLHINYYYNKKKNNPEYFYFKAPNLTYKAPSAYKSRSDNRYLYKTCIAETT